MPIPPAKPILRRHYRQLRASLGATSRTQADTAIARQVRLLDAWAHARTVYAYCSFGAEVDTRALMQAAWAEGKRVVLPCCVPGSRELRWYAVDGLDGLVRGPLGVEEPTPDPAHEVAATGTLDALALVPGLSFDGQGYRLGYGGGYYDGFLSRFAGVSVGLCRAAQLSDAPLPREPHDMPVDLVVCDDMHNRMEAS